MAKLIKLLLGLSVLLVLLAVIVVTAAVMLFDPNQHKDFIAEQVKEKTGRTLDLAGNINMTFYPWLGLEAEKITLGNAEGFGKEAFLYADQVSLRIKTMPLLKKQYELDTLKLHGVKLNLVKDKQGKTNWEDLAGGAAEGKKETAQPFQFAAVILGGVDVKDGQVSWHDLGKDQIVNINGITVTTGELVYGQPINLAVALNAEANKPAMKSNLKMNGILNYDIDSEIYAFKPIDLLASFSGKDVPGGTTNLVLKAAMEANLKAETFSLADLNLDFLGTSVKGGLTATEIKSDNPVSKAQLAIVSADLAKLYQLVDPQVAGELAQLKDRSVDMKLDLESDMALEQVKLSKMDIKLLGANIQGQLAASHIKTKAPAAKGALKASGPDLPALLQVIGQFEGGKEPGMKALGKKLSGLNNKSFDIAAEFDADLKQGNIQVPDFSVNTLGINANGQLDGKDVNSSSPKVKGKFLLKGEKLGGLLTALDKKELGEVLQVFTVDTSVNSDGGDIALSPLQVKATLAGKQIPSSPAEVALNADTRINLKKQTVVMKDMTLKGLGLDVNGNLNASKINTGSPAVNGRLTASGPDLALLFRLSGNESLANQMDKFKDRSFNIKSNLDADMEAGHVKISDLKAKMVGAVIEGHVDARNILTKKPAAKGALKATGPDLPTLMRVAGKFSGKKSSLTQLGKKLADAPDKSFDISTEFDADLAKGDIKLPTLDLKTLGLNLNGKLMASQLDKKNGSIDGRFKLEGRKIDAILAAFDQAPLAEVLQTINIDAGIKGNTGDISLSPLDVKVVLAGKDIPNSPATATFNADSRLNLTEQTLSVKNLVLDGLGLKVTGNVDGKKIVDNPKLKGQIAINEFNLKKLAKQLNQPLPKTADNSVFRKVALKTGFSGGKDSISLDGMTMNLDQSLIQGDFSIKHFSQPQINFGLGINEINVDRYLPPEQKKATKKSAKSGTEQQPAGQGNLPVEMLRTLTANGDVQIGKLIVSNLQLTDIKVGLKAREGDIRLNPVNANLYRGSYNGSVLLDVREKLPHLQFAVDLKGVGMQPLLKDLNQTEESPLAGIAMVNGIINAWGNNPDRFKNTSQGQVKFSIERGTLRGIDVRKALDQAEIMIESKQIGKIDKGGSTHFDRLSGTLDINKGIVRNEDLLMVAPGFQVTGKGMLANLHDNAIKYDMEVAVVEKTATRADERYNLGGYDIPIRCRGLFTQIENACGPDYGGLLGAAVKKGVLEKLGESLGVEKPASKESGTTTPEGTDQKTEPEDPVKKLLEEVIKF